MFANLLKNKCLYKPLWGAGEMEGLQNIFLPLELSSGKSVLLAINCFYLGIFEKWQYHVDSFLIHHPKIRSRIRAGCMLLCCLWLLFTALHLLHTVLVPLFIQGQESAARYCWKQPFPVSSKEGILYWCTEFLSIFMRCRNVNTHNVCCYYRRRREMTNCYSKICVTCGL